MNTDREPGFLARAGGVRIAFRRVKGDQPGIIFFGGFMSDMQGGKATMLERHCLETGRSFLRFDYQGHGESTGGICRRDNRDLER